MGWARYRPALPAWSCCQDIVIKLFLGDGCMADGATGAASPDMKIGVVVIHGVGEAETGWINTSICDPLAELSKELQTTPHSELHRLPDKGAAEPSSRFTVFVR